MAVDWDHYVLGPSMRVFGEAVAYYAPAACLAITGVFDQAYLELSPLGAGEVDTKSFSDLSLGSPGPVTTERPVLGVQLSQFPFNAQPAQADTLVVRGTRYVVKEVRLDGHGFAKLLLNEFQ